MIDSLQRSLSIAQAVPVIGPILVSPVKALVSTAEIIMGIAQTTLCGTGFLVCLTLKVPGSVFFGEQSLIGAYHMLSGTGSLAYSLANFLTFGMTGIFIESTLSGRVCMI